jgi:hypothetical protein
VSSVFLRDKVTNRHELYQAELINLGFPTQFTVTAVTSDTIPPHLAGFDLEPRVVDTAQMSQSILFTASIRDNLAGLESWNLQFHSRSGQYMYSGNYQMALEQNDTYSMTAILPQYSEAGIWTLSYMDLRDWADNQANLGPEDLTALGFPTQFINGSPITPGTQSTLVYPSPEGLTTTLDVPAGAVTDTTYMAYNNLSEIPPVPGGHNFAGRAFALDAYRDMAVLPHFRFNVPPTLTLNYDGTTVTGTQEHNLLVAYWDGDAWVDIADSCPGSTYALQPERDQISVPICHLSQFALLSKFENRLYLPLVLKY